MKKNKSNWKTRKMKQMSNMPSESLDLDLSITGKNNFPVSNIDNDEDNELSHIASSTREIENMKEISLLGEETLQNKKLIHSQMLDYHIVDKFREIRTKLLNVSKNKNFMLMVTSVCKFGGATTVATNLATAFSFDDSKTSLLVDCNLRNPKLHEMLNVELDCGLTNYLEDSSLDIDDIISPTGIKRLRLISAGMNKESSSEYFTSRRMNGFLKRITQRYSDRFIILDAPPLDESPDASILSEMCDFVIVVVPYGKITLPKIESALKKIDKTKLVGVVFNN